MKADILIVGGGIAGLSAGIMARRQGWSVVLVEKKQYPFHKVCGEYISLESKNILSWLGLPIEKWKLPHIDRFGISHGSSYFQAGLPLGGFGVSRFAMDAFLRDQLEAEGGIVLSPCKVTGFARQNHEFEADTTHPSYPKIISKLVLGCVGRNKPSFFSNGGEDQARAETHIGVKFHVKADLPTDLIELHHFPGGYCGISAIENEQHCMCYLLKADASKAFRGNLEAIESTLLSQNPRLKKYLQAFPKITQRVAAGGIFFTSRPLTAKGILLLGDGAGMIPPLAGNGMSMALHAATIAIDCAAGYLAGNQSLEVCCHQYETAWNAAFRQRLRMGKWLQEAMHHSLVTAATIRVFQAWPTLFRWTASRTHGIEIPIPKSKLL